MSDRCRHAARVGDVLLPCTVTGGHEYGTIGSGRVHRHDAERWPPASVSWNDGDVWDVVQPDREPDALDDSADEYGLAQLLIHLLWDNDEKSAIEQETAARKAAERIVDVFHGDRVEEGSDPDPPSPSCLLQPDHEGNHLGRTIPHGKPVSWPVEPVPDVLHEEAE